jgi:hypothetical protein
MADALDKLMIQMDLKEEKPKKSIMMPAAALAVSGALGGGVTAALANPNDFGQVGKNLWMDLLKKNPQNVRGLEYLSRLPRGARNAEMFRKIGFPMMKTGAKFAIPAGLLGLGIDAITDDTEWTDKGKDLLETFGL